MTCWRASVPHGTAGYQLLCTFLLSFTLSNKYLQGLSLAYSAVWLRVLLRTIELQACWLPERLPCRLCSLKPPPQHLDCFDVSQDQLCPSNHSKAEHSPSNTAISSTSLSMQPSSICIKHCPTCGSETTHHSCDAICSYRCCVLAGHYCNLPTSMT